LPSWPVLQLRWGRKSPPVLFTLAAIGFRSLWIVAAGLLGHVAFDVLHLISSPMRAFHHGGPLFARHDGTLALYLAIRLGAIPRRTERGPGQRQFTR
jgi:hypothetical protein